MYSKQLPGSDDTLEADIVCWIVQMTKILGFSKITVHLKKIINYFIKQLSDDH